MKLFKFACLLINLFVILLKNKKKDGRLCSSSLGCETEDMNCSSDKAATGCLRKQEKTMIAFEVMTVEKLITYLLQH